MDAEHRSPAQGLLALTLGTSVASFFVWGSFHDITRGEADPTTEYVFLILCGAWFLYAGLRLIGLRHKVLGAVSLVALAAGLWGQRGIGPGTGPSLDSSYVATAGALLWFVLLAGILAVLSWRVFRQGRGAPVP